MFITGIKETMKSRRVFISADHGLAIVYFLQSDVVSTLLDAGIEVILLTDDGLIELIKKRFGRSGLTVEGLRLPEAHRYAESVKPSNQWWLQFLRRVGASGRINVEALTSHIRQVDAEAEGKRRLLMPFMKMFVCLMRRSKSARNWVRNSQLRYSPDLYSDLFEKYKPDLVISSTPGWRLDRYLLREAARKGVKTVAVVVGWDNPSSYSLPGAPVDWITCWSDRQVDELVEGDDWDPERVHIGGIPSYDGYFRKEWLFPRDEYFILHNLDPERKLLGYACSFITFSPNYQNVEALAKLVAEDKLVEPCQLLIRLHPNHFLNDPLFVGEREKIRQLAKDLPNVHVVEPVPLGGELGYYSGEDMPEKTSMMAYSDVFLTVYSTMVVEAAIHDRPIVSMCIDAPEGWNRKDHFSLALSEIGEWPTHQRFRIAGAGRVIFNSDQLKEAIDEYLRNPENGSENRRRFIQDEVTFTDGKAGQRTGEFLASLVNGNHSRKADL
jgi:CDP-glycerol glycerophosphotransferase (TagB/SpsB family)